MAVRLVRREVTTKLLGIIALWLCWGKVFLCFVRMLFAFLMFLSLAPLKPAATVKRHVCKIYGALKVRGKFNSKRSLSSRRQITLREAKTSLNHSELCLNAKSSDAAAASRCCSKLWWGWSYCDRFGRHVKRRFIGWTWLCCSFFLAFPLPFSCKPNELGRITKASFPFFMRLATGAFTLLLPPSSRLVCTRPGNWITGRAGLAGGRGKPFSSIFHHVSNGFSAAVKCQHSEIEGERKSLMKTFLLWWKSIPLLLWHFLFSPSSSPSFETRSFIQKLSQSREKLYGHLNHKMCALWARMRAVGEDLWRQSFHLSFIAANIFYSSGLKRVSEKSRTKRKNSSPSMRCRHSGSVNTAKNCSLINACDELRCFIGFNLLKAPRVTTG